ncbi:hypothetical protein HMI54_012885 [Coelomomyces lativittatus]|nr:hypothetical protein HMI54_012885 [Coelomomyces lativittatus]
MVSVTRTPRACRGGIGIVKLMGRDSGFIALYSSLASGEANLVLLPEVPFTLAKVCQLVEQRLKENGHILIVVAEGAGQDLAAHTIEKDASGNVKLMDIGLFLKQEIGQYCKTHHIDHSIKYIDPSYTIRGCPAVSTDAIFTVSLAHQAVHAAMAGKTNCIIGLVHDEYVHIPIKKAIEFRKKVDVNSILYQTLLNNTGMPLCLT